MRGGGAVSETGFISSSVRCVDAIEDVELRSDAGGTELHLGDCIYIDRRRRRRRLRVCPDAAPTGLRFLIILKGSSVSDRNIMNGTGR